MAYIPTEDDEIRDVTRKQNRALRIMHRNLRRRNAQLQQQADDTIAALFDAPNEAESALREIWEKTGLKEKCSPDDYDTIVDVVVNTLSKYEMKIAPMPARGTHSA